MFSFDTFTKIFLLHFSCLLRPYFFSYLAIYDLFLPLLLSFIIFTYSLFFCLSFIHFSFVCGFSFLLFHVWNSIFSLLGNQAEGLEGQGGEWRGSGSPLPWSGVGGSGRAPMILLRLPMMVRPAPPPSLEEAVC